MTERQVKIRMTKLQKLIEELEHLKGGNLTNAGMAHADDLKEKINKIQRELTEEKFLPIYPAYLYDTESGAYKSFPEREVE